MLTGLFILTAVLCGLSSVHGAGFELGYSNVLGSTLGDQVTIESGEVPSWLNGSFIRHSCGAFGESGTNANIVNKVDHLFDCIEMGTGFTMEDGHVTFWNRYYDASNADLWQNEFNYNMNESKVFWSDNAYSRHDEDAKDYADTLRDQSIRRSMPHVSWWLVGDVVLAHSEGDQVVQVYPHDLSHEQDDFQYNDNRFGYEGVSIMDEPAHELYDHDGTLWANHMVFKQNGDTVKQWRNVFSINTDAERSTLVEVPHPDIDLSLCTGDRYPLSTEHRQGYMHSFAMSENYIILPETSYLMDPCAMFAGSGSEFIGYARTYSWEPESKSILRVIRKSDGNIMATIETGPFFVTHQLNAYEENGKIYADMLTYDNADIYEVHAMVDNLLDGGIFEAHVHRFVIDMSDWSLESSEDILEGPMTVEMSNINMDFAGLPYTYAYMIKGLFTGQQNVLMKVNVKTAEVLEYALPDGLFGQEPWFVPEPWAADEDAGLVMMQGLDTNQEKGFFMIWDARDLRLLSHVTGTDVVLNGLHNKFFWDPNAPMPTQPDGASFTVPSMLTVVTLVVVAPLF